MIRVPCPSAVLSIISQHFSCQYHISWVDCNSSGMCSKQVGVFEDSYQIPFCSLLQKSVCMQLEANIFLGIITNFKTMPSNGRNVYDKTRFLLIIFNFFQCKLTRSVPSIFLLLLLGLLLCCFLFLCEVRWCVDGHPPIFCQVHVTSVGQTPCRSNFVT